MSFKINSLRKTSYLATMGEVAVRLETGDPANYTSAMVKRSYREFHNVVLCEVSLEGQTWPLLM